MADFVCPLPMLFFLALSLALRSHDQFKASGALKTRSCSDNFFFQPKKMLVLLSASVKRFSVSCMWDFFLPTGHSHVYDVSNQGCPPRMSGPSYFCLNLQLIICTYEHTDSATYKINRLSSRLNKKTNKYFPYVCYYLACKHI